MIKNCQLPNNKLNYTYLVTQIPILFMYRYLSDNNDYCLRYVDFQIK